MTDKTHTVNESADKIRVETDQPWQEKEVLQQLYVDENLTQPEIAELLDCSSGTVSRWLNKHGIDTQSPHDYGDNPWRDKELVNRLYQEKEMSAPEIADELGCSVGPIYDRINDTRSISEANRIWTWKLPPEIRTNHNGYERFRHKINGNSESFAHHRLLAVSEYGFDKLRENVVHHKNGIPWDNRIENLELMPQSAHVREHFEKINIADKLAMLEWSNNTELTHREIAEIKGKSRSTVNTIVYRAKEIAQ